MYLAVHYSESPLKPVSYTDPVVHRSEIDVLLTGAWRVIGLAFHEYFSRQMNERDLVS